MTKIDSLHAGQKYRLIGEEYVVYMLLRLETWSIPFLFFYQFHSLKLQHYYFKFFDVN